MLATFGTVSFVPWTTHRFGDNRACGQGKKTPARTVRLPGVNKIAGDSLPKLKRWSIGHFVRTIAKYKLGRLQIVISSVTRNLTLPMEREILASWQG